MSNLIYSSGVLSWLGDNIVNGIASFFYTILLWLNCIIYSFISFVYQIFLILAGGGSIFDAEAINGLVDRVYVIIGVVILFLVAYSLLKNMVNPDEAIKGKKSPVNIIKDVIISVVLIAFIPTIFDFAFEFQNSLLIENTIGKLIAGSPNNSSDVNDTIRMGGFNMAKGVWQAFIYVNPDGDPSGKPYCRNQDEEQSLKTSDGQYCTKVMVDDSTSYGDLWKQAENNTTFYTMIGLVPRILDDQVTYLFLLDIVAGAFVLLVLLSYCLDMALRLVKLAVYELIAPLPILARIIPNEQASKTFSNWLKATISTFVEVFIRIAILYFAVIIIATVGRSLDNLFVNGAYAASDTLPFVKTLAQALIIIGIVLFVKQAPEIIKEITGLDSGKYNVLGSAMRGLSTIGALTTGAVKSFNTTESDDKHKFRSGLNKFAHGFTGGLKSLYNAAGKEYKSPKDIKSNTHSAVEDVLNKQRKRQAAALAKKQELAAYQAKNPQQAGESDFKYQARTKFGNFKKTSKENILDWAGVGVLDSAAVTRTKELADRVTQAFSSQVEAYKGPQAYKDAKSEKDNAEALAAAAKAKKDAGVSDADIAAEFGKSYADIVAEAATAKAKFAGIERAEMKKKADTIAAGAREIQLAQAQYSDIEIAQKAILERESDTTKRTKMEAAFNEYSDLSDKATFQKLIHDLGSDVDAERERAKLFVDYLDNTKKEAAMMKNDAIYAEQAKGYKKKEEK